MKNTAKKTRQYVGRIGKALITLVLIVVGAACNSCQSGPGLTPCERDLLHAHAVCLGKVQIFTDGAGLYAVCSDHTPNARWVIGTEREIRERGMAALISEHRAYRIGDKCVCMDAYAGEAGPVHACLISEGHDGPHILRPNGSGGSSGNFSGAESPTAEPAGHDGPHILRPNGSGGSSTILSGAESPTAEPKPAGVK